MERTGALLDRTALRRALAALLDKVAATHTTIAYRLIGTAAALLHGVDLPAGDVDILVKRREDVDAFSAALSGCLCLVAPVLLHGGLQYFARYDVGGVEVEFSTIEVEPPSDLFEASGPGPWRYYAELPCGHHRVPTVALELRLLTELQRDRPDRYGPILDYLATHGCDLALVRRGLEASEMADSLRQEVWARLTAAANPTP